jgi:hypothetical protein
MSRELVERQLLQKGASSTEPTDAADIKDRMKVKGRRGKNSGER